jgi:uncharacterized membrane protein
MDRATIAAILGAATTVAAAAGPPQYTIVDLGLVAPGDSAAQGFGVSPGGVATGRSVGASNQAFSWTVGDGLVGLPNLATRPFSVGNGANDQGAVVGTGSTTLFGSSPLPLIWESGVVAQLPLPPGETLGRANDVNASGVAVGSVDGGSNERAAIYARGGATIITATTAEGSFMNVAFGVNDAGLVAGTGIDPSNAARNVGLVYDVGAGTMIEVGALPGLNGALAFDIGNGGHVVGSSMLNQGAGTPFIWTAAGGMHAIPLPAGTSQGSARGVNAAGWAVGTASSAFAIPFLFDGSSTHAVADLLPPGSGWDLSTNTSSSARGISDGGVIVGTGVHNGGVRAYAMIPVAPPCPADLDDDGAVAVGDLVQLILAWGPCSGCPEDLDGSGDVGVTDLVQLVTGWGDCG